MEKVLANEIEVDGTFSHPFTMVLAGPSGSGKSTYVNNLMKNYEKYIDETFDYIYIMIGTDLTENVLFTELLSNLKEKDIKTEVWEINKLFPNEKSLQEEFPKYFLNIIQDHKIKKEKGCLIIDDLMKEMADSDVLMNLFTRMSTHSDISIIFLTQNLFFQGKKKSNNTTIFRNIKYLILFYSKIDKSTLRYVVSRIGDQKNNKKLFYMLDQLMKEHRYIVFNLDLNKDEEITFSTNTFAKDKLFNEIDKISFMTIFKPNF